MAFVFLCIWSIRFFCHHPAYRCREKSSEKCEKNSINCKTPMALHCHVPRPKTESQVVERSEARLKKANKWWMMMSAGWWCCYGCFLFFYIYCDAFHQYQISFRTERTYTLRWKLLEMEFVGSYLLFLVIGTITVTGFCAMMFSINHLVAHRMFSHDNVHIAVHACMWAKHFYGVDGGVTVTPHHTPLLIFLFSLTFNLAFLVFVSHVSEAKPTWLDVFPDCRG